MFHKFPATYTILVIGTRKDQIMKDFFDNNGGVEYIPSQSNNS